MRLTKFLSKTRIIDIKSADFEGALKELLSTADESVIPADRRPEILQDLMTREESISTYLGESISMPHSRVDFLKDKYVFFVGRTPNGLKYGDRQEYKDIRFVFMLLASSNEDGYLNMLNSLARVFSEKKTIARILASKTLGIFRNRVMESFTCQKGRKERTARANRVFLDGAEIVAKGSKCSAVVVMGDTFMEGVMIGRHFKDTRVILVTEGKTEDQEKSFDAVVNVRMFSQNRMSQLSSAILLGLTKGILRYNDKLCCIGGVADSDRIDTIIVVDIQKDFSHLFTQDHHKMLPEGVRPEVVERVADLATELSIEGREGKPVGCIFVVGDKDKLKPYLKQMVLNPFYGYNAEDRNVLSPFMNETVKEYSIDRKSVV